MTDDQTGPVGVPTRRNTKKIIAVFIAVLVVGLAAGVTLNFIFAKPATRKVERKKSESPTTSESSGSTASGAGGTSQSAEPAFSTPQAMSHVFVLSDQVGPRKAGSVKESGAADYIVSKLGEYGYNVEEQPFTMADGFGSRNIVGTRRGTREGYDIAIAAHYDSPSGSPGADDNATGVGVVLELARVFSGVSDLQPSLQFVFLGANRPGVSDLAKRLDGARRYLELLGSMQKKDVVGMIAIDSVGKGEVLALRTQGTGLQRLRDKLATFAGEKKIDASAMKSTDDSDNIPFENSEMPAVWVEWCDQDGTLSTDNLYTGVEAGKVEAAGNLIEGFIKNLSSQDLEELKY
jgi:Zn-dependent M28 family amino/carboxypeptidase